MEKIQIFIDSNEKNSDRAKALIQAAAKEARFAEPCFAELDVDVCFRLQHLEMHRSGDIFSEKIYNVELKDFSDDGRGSDYVSSIRSRHMWEQCLTARESGQPYAICVLGDDTDIQAAIREIAGHDQKGRKRGFDLKKFEQYSAMVDGFESNCIGLNIPVWHLGYNQYSRLLLRVRKILEGGDLSGFAPHPSENEREIVGLSILAGNGIGPAKAAAILEKFRLVLEAKENSDPNAKLVYYTLADCTGIGPKLGKRIKEKIEVLE